MMRLVLVRHAQAESALPGQSDFDRLLTRRGVSDAGEMARRLKRRKIHVDFCLASPAVRTVSTAKGFAAVLKLGSESCDVDDRLYTADTKDYLAVVHELESEHRTVLIVGHNPGITEFADRLAEERRIEGMPTCATVCLEFSIASWTELTWHSGRNVEFDYPDRTDE